MVRKKSKNTDNILDLGFEEDIEFNGFDDCISGTPVSSFSFNNDFKSTNTTSTLPSDSKVNLIDNRIGKSKPNGITPPVNGEKFDLNRTYTFRKSTIRKLNELKAIHPDVSVYLSSILDAAINHYYDYITKNDGKQV